MHSVKRHLKKRLLLGLVFAGLDFCAHTSHELSSAPYTYLFYMGVDYFAILLTLELDDTPLSIDLSLIQLAAIAVHGFGFVLYILYYPPFIYDMAVLLLCVLQWLRLFTVTNDDDKDYLRLSKYPFGYFSLSSSATSRLSSSAQESEQTFKKVL